MTRKIIYLDKNEAEAVFGILDADYEDMSKYFSEFGIYEDKDENGNDCATVCGLFSFEDGEKTITPLFPISIKSFENVKAFLRVYNDIPGQISFVSEDVPDYRKKIKLTKQPNTPLINVSKRFINNPKKLESTRYGQIQIENFEKENIKIITYKGKDAEYTISVEQVKEKFAKRVQNGTKVFNFLLQKLNEQNRSIKINFLLQELVDIGMYANPDSAYRGLKNVLDKLMSIHISGKEAEYDGKKRREIMRIKAALISQTKVSYNECSIEFPSLIREANLYITILPDWSYSLSDTAYMLFDYIMYMARQRTIDIKEKGCFEISLETIRKHLGLLDPETIKKEHNRNYAMFIIDPIENAIAEIENTQQGDSIQITPIYPCDHKNVHEYLSGHLEIKIHGDMQEYFAERAVKLLEKNPQKGKNKTKKKPIIAS